MICWFTVGMDNEALWSGGKISGLWFSCIAHLSEHESHETDRRWTMTNHNLYFTAQTYYYTKETVMAKHAFWITSADRWAGNLHQGGCQRIVAEERKRQFAMDDTRIHGNAFFAGRLSITSAPSGARGIPSGRESTSLVWCSGEQFEINSGRGQHRLPQQTVAPAARRSGQGSATTDPEPSDETTGRKSSKDEKLHPEDALIFFIVIGTILRLWQLSSSIVARRAYTLG